MLRDCNTPARRRDVRVIVAGGERIEHDVYDVR
jgi:hypothetical protein